MTTGNLKVKKGAAPTGLFSGEQETQISKSGIVGIESRAPPVSGLLLNAGQGRPE